MIARAQLRRLLALLWGATAISLAALLLFFTPRGLGMSPDSVAYLKSVQGLFLGKGFTYFSVQWPPLYSLLIALTAQAVSHDFYLGSRILNAILYGIFFILTGALLRHITASFSYLTYCFASLLMLHPLITHIYFYALSETLFLPLVIIDFILLACLISPNQTSRAHLVLALAMVAFAANLARYAGLCILALNAVALYLSAPQQKPLKKLFFEILIQILPTVLFLLLWRQRLGVGDTETNLRPFVVHLVTFDNINQGLINLGHWLLAFIKIHEAPSLQPLCWGLGSTLLGLVFVIAGKATLKIYSCRRSNDFFSTESWITFLSATFILGYLFFLILIRSFFDPNIIFDNRTLSPIFIPMIIFLLVQVKGISVVPYRLAAITFIITLLVFSLQTIRPWLLINYFNGVELTYKNRLNNKLLSFIRSCPSDAVVYADRPWNINLEFNSMVHWLPTHGLYGSWLPNPRYTQQISELKSSADMIVVEDLGAEIIQSIERLNAFTRIHTSEVGIVWLNKRFNMNYCQGSYSN